MNVQDFTYLLQNPDKVVSPVQTKQLEDVLEEYPYFQSARALHLKGLKNLNSFKYNNALKITAAYTADRDILFDFITSTDFLQNTIADTISGKSAALVDTEIVSEEIVPDTQNKSVLIEDSKDRPLPQNAKDADSILDPKLFKSKKTENDLGLGEPLPFTKKEKFSFSEWLQLTSSKKIERNTDISKRPVLKDIKFSLEEEVLKKKKFELIDKFIADNPKIVPSKDVSEIMALKPSEKFDKNELMTETLAKVYLEQKKYKKAVQAYRILSLKYPEKSGFFADRIKAVDKIQKENS